MPESRLRVVVAGVGLQIAGLALDGWLHSRDATLAASEGVFTLGNPGHALFTFGLVLTIIGVSLMAGTWIQRNRSAGTRLGRWAGLLPALGMVIALVVAAGALGAGSTRAAGQAHPHEAVADSDGQAGHSHRAVPISWERIQEIDRMLARAKDAVRRYDDVDLARADGYLQETQVMVEEGAHFVNPRLLAADAFDPVHPPYLIYQNGVDGDLELAGVAWALPRRPGDWTTPRSPVAPLATWHTHNFGGACIRKRGQIEEAVMNIYPHECSAAGGTYLGEHPWILHGWLFAPSPEGVFGHINSAIEGLDPLA